MKDIVFKKVLVVGIIILFIGAGVAVPNIRIFNNIEKSFYASAEEIVGSASNNPPFFGNSTPDNNSVDNPLNFIWSIPINDTEGDFFDWSIECSNGQSISMNDELNGTKNLSITGLDLLTEYIVWVNATDIGSGNWSREWFIFTTKPNYPPIFGDPSPLNNSGNHELSLVWSIPINDTEGDFFNWSIECSNGQSDNASNDINGSKILSLSNLSYFTTYILWVNATDFNGSGNYTREWFSFSTLANNPPVFIAPNPMNSTIDISVATFQLNINIQDDEHDSFDWSIETSPDIGNSGATGASNGIKTCSISGLNYDTTYTWYVNATDPSGSGQYTREWFTFTTEVPSEIIVNITKPVERSFYFQNELVFPLLINTIIYGAITIEVDASSVVGIDRVELYVNNRTKDAWTDNDAPYSFEWNPIICGPYKIKVIAYDDAGQSKSDEISVIKWRVHPLLILAGSVFIFKQIRSGTPFQWTILRGTVFNLKQVGNKFHGRAIRLHYKEIAPFSSVSGTGTIKLRKIKFANGPFMFTRDMGPGGLTTYVFGIFPGKVNGILK